MASTNTTPKINLRMGADELDLLDDLIDYYAEGRWCRIKQDDSDMLLDLKLRVDSARARLARVGSARCDKVTMGQRCLLRTGHPGGHVSSEWGI